MALSRQSLQDARWHKPPCTKRGDNMFIVVSETSTIIGGKNTAHIHDRARRVLKVERLIIEEKARPMKAFVINKGHCNGNEIHVVYNNGVVRIYNQRTMKHITDLIAREAQIKRYGITITKTMQKKIRKHINAGLNEI